MSLIPKTRNPAIRQFCQLLLTINSLGTLVVVKVASRCVPLTPRIGTSLAMHRLRPVLAGHGHLAAKHMELPTPTHHLTATLGPVRGVAAAITRNRQSLWGSYPALIGCLTSPGPRPSSRRSFSWHTTCGISSPLSTPSTPPGLPLPHCQKITMSGGRHLPMAVISSG
jgi:hypothetical protein